MGKHRPVSDRIAETQAQLSALMAKAAKDQINDSPEIQEIDSAIKSIQISMLKYNRWASEGEDKIENFLKRAEQWRDRLADAQDKRKKAGVELDALRLKRKTLAEELASSLEIEQDA
jgi:chromosome segregation ATPase